MTVVLRSIWRWWVAGIFVFSTQSYADIGQIQSALEAGNAKDALRQADRLLSQTIALKIKAQARLNQADQALRTYEVMVSLTGKEDLALLQEVGWAYVNKLLQGDNKRAQQMIAEYLGVLKDRRAVPVLIRLLQRSSDFVTKRYAVESLGFLRDERAVSVLSKEMKGRNFLVQTSAAWALANIGNQAGLRMLQKCFKTASSVQKLRCASMLARLKKREVRGYLRSQLKSNNNRRAREVIAKGLAALGDKSWISVIIKDLRSNLVETRLISARVLGELKAKTSNRQLRAALRDNSTLVKITAARSLGQLGAKTGASVLETALSDGKVQTRTSAAEALVDVGDKKRLSALQKTLSDKHLVVRVYAAHALAVLKRQDGGGVVREALARGNEPLQALATKVALELVRLSSSEGKPFQRMSGTLSPARVVKAFVDKGGDDDDDSGFQEDADSRKTSHSSQAASKRKTTKATKAPKRRKPAGRKKDDDEGEDEW